MTGLHTARVPAEVYFRTNYLIRGKKSGKSLGKKSGKKVWEKSLGKVFCKGLNFSPMKFSPDFLFPDQYFSLIFFHLTKNLSRFFFNYYYYYCYYYFLFIRKIYYYHVFLCTLFIVVEQSSFNKNFEMRMKVKLKLKVKLVAEKWRIWNIRWGKVTNFSEVTKFFPDENFPRLFFADKV